MADKYLNIVTNKPNTHANTVPVSKGDGTYEWAEIAGEATADMTQDVGFDSKSKKLKTKPAPDLKFATSSTIGGIKAEEKTSAETNEVKIDAASGKLYSKGLSEISQASETALGGIKAKSKTADDSKYTNQIKIDDNGFLFALSPETVSVAESAKKLVDASASPINSGTNETPIYFKNGIPAESTSKFLHDLATVTVTPTAVAPETPLTGSGTISQDQKTLAINFDVPKGAKGDPGDSITAVEAPTITGQSIDTYKVKSKDKQIGTFDVHNGSDGKSIGSITGSHVPGDEALSTYEMHLNDTAKTSVGTFQVQNGSSGTAAGIGLPTCDNTDADNVGTASVEVSASGDNTNKIFNFKFNNLKGNQGQAASIAVNEEVTVLDPSSTAGSVINEGTSSDAILKFSLPKGDPGKTPIKGQDYNDGEAATISVDPVVDILAAGTPGEVTNKGSSSAAILKFKLPSGKTPIKGVDYDDGAPGPNEVNTNTKTNFTADTLIGSDGSKCTSVTYATVCANTESRLTTELATKVDSTDSRLSDARKADGGHADTAAKSERLCMSMDNIDATISDGASINLQDGVITYTTAAPIHSVTFNTPSGKYNCYAKVAFNEIASPILLFNPPNDQITLHYLGYPEPAKPNTTYEISFMNNVIAIIPVGREINKPKETV